MSAETRPAADVAPLVTSTDQAITALLHVIRQTLNVQVALVAHHDGDHLRALWVAPDDTAELPRGTMVPLTESFGQQVLATLRPLVVCDATTYRAAARWQNVHSASAGSYVGVPVTLSDGTVFGTLCAIDPAPHAFGPSDAAVLGRLATVIAFQIEHDTLTREVDDQFHSADDARAELQAVLDGTNEAVVLVDPERRFLRVNRRFAELFGINADEVVGRRFDELQPYVLRVFADPTAFRDRVAGTAGLLEGEFRDVVVQRWPERRELELYSTPVRSGEGYHLGRLYAFRDVTQEREAARAKTEFVSLVSHELRTPLTSIKGYVDLLLDGDAGPLPAEQGELLEIVKHNADRLVALIGDLLDIARIEAGKVELRRQPLDLGPLLQGVAAAFNPLVQRAGQALALALPADLPAVWGDGDRLVQVFTNLVSNAHKYTPVGGRLRVEAAAAGPEVRVSVADTGVGMSAAELAQLYTKFYRADNPTTRAAGGTGLGLSITRSLVELHGGHLAVRSQPGQGSTFTVTLPVAADAPVRAATTVQQPRGACILVVDDDADVARLISRHLERGGYTTQVVHTGSAALRAAQAQRPDLIILDIRLGDEDGFTVLEWLKNDPRTAAIPVILLSIVPDEGRGDLLGAVEHLTKPTPEAVLLERVAHVLANGRPRVVLVADDDRDSRELITGHLARAGYAVLEAADGADAVALAREKKPGLVLMDVRMPGTDGITALRHLRAEPATRDLPVVMMTASPGALEQSRSTVEAIGVTALLEKPSTAAEVAAAIAQALNRGRRD